MPDIVAKGRKPKVIACAYCHTPTGQGRPENSALAGLPEAYIKEQLEALPQRQTPARRARDIRAEPRHAGGGRGADRRGNRREREVLLAAEAGRAGTTWSRASTSRAPSPPTGSTRKSSGTEDLGERLLEVAPDITRHQRRDERMQYTVYAPPGSLMRGKSLATTGDKGKTPDLRHLPSQPSSRARTRFRPSPAARLPTCCASCIGVQERRAQQRGREADGCRWSRSSSSTTWWRWRPTWDRSTRRR